MTSSIAGNAPVYFLIADKRLADVLEVAAIHAHRVAALFSLDEPFSIDCNRMKTERPTVPAPSAATMPAPPAPECPPTVRSAV